MAIMIGVLSLAVFSIAIIRANNSMVFAASSSSDVVQQGEYSGQYGDQLIPDTGVTAAAPHSHAAVHSVAAATITTTTTSTNTTATDQQEGDYSGEYGDQLAPDTGSSGE